MNNKDVFESFHVTIINTNRKILEFEYCKMYFFSEKKFVWSKMSVVLVQGASRGIGLEFARVLRSGSKGSVHTKLNPIVLKCVVRNI